MNPEIEHLGQQLIALGRKEITKFNSLPGIYVLASERAIHENKHSGQDVAEIKLTIHLLSDKLRRMLTTELSKAGLILGKRILSESEDTE